MRMSPSFCKELIKVMQENMAGFEEHFGEVKIMETPKGKQ